VRPRSAASIRKQFAVPARLALGGANGGAADAEGAPFVAVDGYRVA
jgi:hypothetical protein